jgi:hypothetical protein
VADGSATEGTKHVRLAVGSLVISGSKDGCSKAENGYAVGSSADNGYVVEGFKPAAILQRTAGTKLKAAICQAEMCRG